MVDDVLGELGGEVGGELEAGADTPDSRSAVAPDRCASDAQATSATSTASSTTSLAFTMLRRRADEAGSTEPVWTQARHRDHAHGRRSINVSGFRGALMVTLTAVGVVGCASATPDQLQAQAPMSSGLQSTQVPRSEPASSSPQAALPESLAAACGHPGAQAVLIAVPITVPKAQCDLTGVVVRWGETGVTVPREGGVQGNWDGISTSFEFGAHVDPTTGDVTFTGSKS